MLSEARKPAGDPAVKAWMAEVDSAELFLSVLVAGEIRQGVERLRRRDPTQAARFDQWLATLARDYRDRIVPVSAAVADTWGRMNAAGPLPVIDGLLAATAAVHGLTLVTRNTAHVERTGVALLNPFSTAQP